LEKIGASPKGSKTKSIGGIGTGWKRENKESGCRRGKGGQKKSGKKGGGGGKKTKKKREKNKKQKKLAAKKNWKKNCRGGGKPKTPKMVEKR